MKMFLNHFAAILCHVYITFEQSFLYFETAEPPFMLHNIRAALLTSQLFSTTTQRIALHLKLKLMQYRNAVVEMEI